MYGKDPNACVVEAVSNKWLPGQGRVLLIGEGEGRNAVYLASQGFECVSSDPSKRALEKAEKGKPFWMRMTAMAAGLLGVVSAGVGSRLACG